MKKLKWLKGLALSSFVGMTAISLVACGPTANATHAFTNSPTNYLQDTNSPLNGTFNNSPISTYAQTSLYGLTTYQTTGQFKTDGQGNFTETTNDTLILEGASAVIAFESEDVMKDVDNKLDNNLITESGINQKEILEKLPSLKDGVEKSNNTSSEQTENATEDESQTQETTDSTNNKWSDGVNYWVFTRDKGGIQFQEGLSSNTPKDTISTYYNNAVSKATVYQFIIDTENQWVDGNGVGKQPVSSKDFERGLETYALASAIGYTRNSYFLDLVGLGENNLNKTVSYKAEGKEEYVSPSDPSYDVENYANKNDAVYTLYIDEAYPYTLDLISKEYFGALPHTNQKVKNISLKSGKIQLKNGKIDESLTKFEDIFGSSGLGHLTKDTWYAGAYYISAFTSSQIIFNINNTYMEKVGKDLLSYVNGKAMNHGGSQNTDSRMQQIVINYGSGTADTYVENFKAEQIDYLSSVPAAKRNEVAQSLSSSIVPTKVVQTTQSNYIAYTPNPYVVTVGTDKSTKIEPNANLGNMVDFIYQWDSKEAMIIRAGIAGLINHDALASVAYPISKDFQLSATPYGVFKDYYENVAKGNFYGALPRPYSDYANNKEDIFTNGFKMPYYSYNSDSSQVEIEEVEVNKQSFIEAIKHFQDKTKPTALNFSIKFGEGSYSTNYESYLLGLQDAIKKLSDDNIQVSLNYRTQDKPSVMEWFNNQSSPLGFSYWAPDYNGVGTWIEADTTIGTTEFKESNDSTKYEGVPGTNAHNSFHTFLESMVYAVKLMNYTWDASSNKYIANTNGSSSDSTGTTSDPYSKDQKIQKAFSNDTLKAFNIETNDASFNGKNTPGERYGAIAIELLNLLIEKGVFDQDKLTKYINDPNQLNYLTNKPTKISDLYIGSDVIKPGQSANFSKYLGIFAGQSTAKALYENIVLDSDYSFIPRPEPGLKETLISLVNPKYVARSGTQSVNYRDFGIKNN